MRALVRHVERHRPVRDRGFTLVELVVAMVILAGVAVAIIGVILNAQKAGVANRDRVAASNLASREIEIAREQFNASASGPETVASQGVLVNGNPLGLNGVAGQPLVVDGTPYTVTRSAQWNVTGTGASACEGGSLVAYPTLNVTVSVTWPRMGSAHPVTNATTLAPSKDVGIPTTDAFIAVKVSGQDGSPLTGVAMQAVGGGTYTAATDTTGCAVLEVSPAVAGTTYTVSVADGSYVDISDTPNPSKTTGLVTQGSLYSGASFTVARPGTATVRLVDSSGNLLTNAQANGATVTLVASEYSGASGATSKVATGATTVFSNLWPTTYGAYFGSTPPVGGYSTVRLDPGGNVTLNVSFQLAAVPVDQLPTGTTAVVAVPTGNSCTSSGAISTAVSGTGTTVQAMPGQYDLYLNGSTFSCSPGPVNVQFVSGDNSTVDWSTPTLQLTGAPGATVWALNQAKSGLSSLSTCPGSAYAGSAVNIDAARSGPMTLPAGNWFVWQTNGAAAGTCLSYPDAISPLALPYASATTKSWALSPTSLKVTGVNKNLWFVVTTTVPTTCKGTTFTPTPTLGKTQATTSSATLTLSAPRTSPSTVYHAYLWDQTKTTGTGSTFACQDLGTYTVAATTGASLSKTASSTGNVGP